MKAFKKAILVSLVAANAAFSSGIPVVDAAANSQMLQQNMKQVLEWAKEAKRWTDTALHYKSQLEAYAKELEAQSGIRDAVSFLQDAKDIYDEAKAVGQNISEIKDFVSDAANIKNSLSSKAKELMNKYFEYDRCNRYSNAQQQNICYQKQSAVVENIVFLNERSENISSYTKDLNKLAKKLKNSKDVKESADIGNAIQLKVALLQAEKIQIDLMNDKKERNKEVIEERERAEALKQWNTSLGDDFFKGN
ncbi:transport associated protein 4 [Campylobacter fetus subsp. venerealis cfvi02/298]|nr:transport associated protein 4 [Campylobacter fetus subsp. venerealis cfvi02/298]